MQSETESIDTRCATCRETTPHNVLKGRVVSGGRAVEGTFECTVCRTVHQGLAAKPVPLRIPIMVSVGAQSYPAQVEVFDDDQVAVGDEFEIGDDLVEVTSVELKDQARRVRRAKTPDIHTLWGKSIREITVGFSMNVGDVTKSFETVFGPEDEIAVGEDFDLEGEAVIVDRVLTTEGKRYRGTYNVRDIKRVWLRRKRTRPEPVREDRPKRGPGSNAPKKPRGGAKAPRSAGRSGGPSRGPPRGAGRAAPRAAPGAKRRPGGAGASRSDERPTRRPSTPRAPPGEGRPPRKSAAGGGRTPSRGPPRKGAGGRGPARGPGRGPARGKSGDKRRGPPRRR